MSEKMLNIHHRKVIEINLHTENKEFQNLRIDSARYSILPL